MASWVRTMVGHPFLCGKEEVYYGAGNPMGAYSSWATFALAHHFVVFVACRQACVRWSTARYVLLGDDILIADSRVAKKYTSLLDLLGVEKSPSKTYVSFEMCEFAKRLLYQGEEITPFPVSSVSQTYWSIPEVVSTIRGESRKGYHPIRGVPAAVRSLQEDLIRNLGPVRARVVEEEAFLCELGTKLLSGEISADDYFIVVGGDLVRDWGDEVRHGCEALTFQIMARQFESSLSGKGSVFDLYSEYQRSYRRACGSLSWPEFCTAFPVTHCMERMSKTMYKLESDLTRPIGKDDDWALMVKGLHNPFRPESFGLAPHRRAARVGHRLGRQVRKIIQDPVLWSTLLTSSRSRPLTNSGVVLLLRTPGGA